MPQGQKPRNIKWKQQCYRFNKDFKNGQHQKNNIFFKKEPILKKQDGN